MSQQTLGLILLEENKVGKNHVQWRVHLLTVINVWIMLPENRLVDMEGPPPPPLFCFNICSKFSLNFIKWDLWEVTVTLCTCHQDFIYTNSSFKTEVKR
jgi:hypothetical protein